jgi:hypothetical protein
VLRLYDAGPAFKSGSTHLLVKTKMGYEEFAGLVPSLGIAGLNFGVGVYLRM